MEMFVSVPPMIEIEMLYQKKKIITKSENLTKAFENNTMTDYSVV
jgi:hypothetical protein